LTFGRLSHHFSLPAISNQNKVRLICSESFSVAGWFNRTALLMWPHITAALQSCLQAQLKGMVATKWSWI